VGVGDVLGEPVVVRVIEGVALRDGEELEEGEPEAEGDLDSGGGI
jgi:hypothetical protein